MIKKIIVAIDRSLSALNAAEYAIKLSKKLDAKLEVIYVVVYSIGNIDAGITSIEIEQQEKEKALKLMNKIKKENPEIRFEDLEIIGRPTKEIGIEILRWHADLLIIGHHTHSFFNKLLNDSIEKKLIKHLKIPILIIPENYSF